MKITGLAPVLLAEPPSKDGGSAISPISPKRCLGVISP